MAMAVAIPAHLEKIEREVGLLRRNSTGGLGIQMAKYKVMSRYLCVPTGSCHDACKGVESDHQTTKARTSLLRRSVEASEKITEQATNVKLQIRKKPLSSRKQPVKFQWRTAGKARSQENAYSMSKSYKLGRRKYNEIIIPGGLPIRQGPLLESVTSTPNQGIRIVKDSGASALSKKKAIRKPANMEKIEPELDNLRRNSTGNVGIEMGGSKVLSRHVTVPTSSCPDTSKDGTGNNLKTKARTHMSTRSVTTSGVNSEVATTVKWQIRKKPLTSTKTPANSRRLTTSHREKMPRCTKRPALARSHQSDLKVKPLEENGNDVPRSNKLSRRRYSDSLITGGSPILQGSLLDDATSAPNTGNRLNKYTGPYELSKKKGIWMPANLDKVESKVGYLRRNSTGSLDTNMGESKVLSCFLSAPTGSHQEVCKYAVECDLKTKARTLQPTRSVTTSVEDPVMATTVKPQTGKKPLSSSKLPNFRSRNIFRSQGQKIPACTKIAVSVNHLSDLKLKPLEENASSMSRSNNLRSRRHSDVLIAGESPILRGSLLDRATSRSNKGNRTDQDTGSSEQITKKNVITTFQSTRSSVKRVSGKKSNNISQRMVSIRNKRASLTSKTSFVRMKTVQPRQENSLNKASQLQRSGSLKQGKVEQGNRGSVPKKNLYIGEQKAKSQTIQLSRETRKVNISSSDRLNRHGAKRGNRSSPLLSPSSSLPSDGSSSRNISNRKSSLSSISACESFDGDTTFVSSKKSGAKSQSQDTKAGRTAICSPKNLKFRRGKIIDFQSEKVTPRRLKFRPIKILDNSENGSAYVRGRGFRRLFAAGRSIAAKDEAMKVNLRHQSRGDKKEAPILFNNVIEETATKLVETRRSKVKALVGAFETIISLQDPRSSPPIIWR